MEKILSQKLFRHSAAAVKIEGMTSPAPSILLEIQHDQNGRIYSHVRQKYLVETPEERVRQEYLLVLHNEYGYALDQIDEEVDPNQSGKQRGTAQARADFAIYRSAADKNGDATPLVIVECKSDNVTIRETDYQQGENYARLNEAPFFVTHNSKETRFWKVLKDKRPGYRLEISDIPHAHDSQKEIDALLTKLKTFKEDDFASLLHKCHNIIRNRDHLDPAAAFDEIAKILFVKVWVERDMRAKKLRLNRFTTDYMDSLPGHAPLDLLFTETRNSYKGAHIFRDDEKINLKAETGRAIVKELEVYNLSDTSEDIKGIAFERFLGRTFRGEIGQFFTPRSIVEFMIRMIDPRKDDIICDPASGSGGFLIRFFEMVRQQQLAQADARYADFKAKVEADVALNDETRGAQLREEYRAIQIHLKQQLDRLANHQIFGTDANDRMARTSKMNMIMHGDGHAGVHHRNGFLNVNGIFEGRFSVILTNPPFGSSVEETDRVPVEPMDREVEDRYIQLYGKPYEDELARQRSHAARGPKDSAIAKMFDLGQRGTKIKTEILFIERCLRLLQPGGRLGIVLPEGIFNNPSLDYVREYCEDRAQILAVVSLPTEAFVASGASVKTSLLFLKKFTDAEKLDYDTQLHQTRLEIRGKHQSRVDQMNAEFDARILAARQTKNMGERKLAESEQRAFKKAEAARQEIETRALHKERFAYNVFLYEAQNVGITATGDDDWNELLPANDEANPRGLPSGVTVSTLEMYRLFRDDAPAFAAAMQAQIEAQAAETDDEDESNAEEEEGA